MVTWTNPTVGVGWIIALIVLLVTLIFWGMGLMGKEIALPICAICAVRL